MANLSQLYPLCWDFSRRLDHWLARFNQFYKASNKAVDGVVVSIAAFQAVNPGSIPGRRIDFCALFFLLSCSLNGQKVASNEWYLHVNFS